MDRYTFAAPEFFVLFVLFIPLIIWYFFRWKRLHPTLQYSRVEMVADAGRSFRHYLLHMPFVLRLLGLAMLIVALARPQTRDSWQKSTTEGIDIVMVIDISSSMLAQDFQPNRLEAAKTLGIEFVSGRPTDRIGLVAFSGEAFTKCPLTTNQAVIVNQLSEIRSGMIEDGTAIGLGLGTAVLRLQESKAKSRVVILLTDGVNNSGEIDPLTAAALAKDLGIRVYTIGVGTYGQAPYPMQTPFGIQHQLVDVEIDEELMQKISASTDGQYFRATNNDKLKEIYGQIDKLERTKMDVKEFSKKLDEYFVFLLFAAVALLAEFFLRNTLLRSLA